MYTLQWFSNRIENLQKQITLLRLMHDTGCFITSTSFNYNIPQEGGSRIFERGNSINLLLF